MTMSRAELQDAAAKAFGNGTLFPDQGQNWKLIADMGWLMMAVPEELGGLGLGREAAGVIHMALGSALVPGPALAQMLVIEALQATRREAAGGFLERAMGGEIMTASLAGPSAQASMTCAPDADRASHILLIDDGRIALAPLTKASIAPRKTWDRTRRLFDISLPEKKGEVVLAEGEEAMVLAQRVEGLKALALAADSLGGAGTILRLTIDYLETRKQFDRPLALFQALKHRVADLKTMLAAAEALFWSTAAKTTTPLVELGALKAHATQVYEAVTEEAIQLHGGIGLTAEHHCHLFLKRAMLNCALGGDADHWEEASGRARLDALLADR